MPFVPDQPSSSQGSFQPDPRMDLLQRQPFSIKQELMNDPTLILPWGLQARGMKEASKLIEHGAYKAGGAMTDLASKLGVPSDYGNAFSNAVLPTAQGAGYVTNVGIQALPVIASSYLTSTEVAPKLESMSRRLMQSALKPSVKEMETGRGAAAISTALERGYNSSSGEVERLTGQVGDLEKKIQNALNASGKTVDKGEIAGRLQDVISRIERTSMNPQDRVKAVEDVYNQVLSNQRLPNAIPVSQANEIKQGIYQMLRDKFGELGSDAVEAQKALARGVKETVAKAEPGVAVDLKEQSALANLLNIMRRRAAVEGNTGIGSLAPLASNPVAAVGFLADKYGLTKSMLARLLYSGTQQGVPTAAGGIAGAALANQLGLGTPEK